ncbi:poly(A) RNA polymerase, mitochondrial-like isoform X2 [Venturia canescens]|nr:poly(A) RNA polymerase, mitochondrial-like isoform X2 [Venturia canescens]
MHHYSITSDSHYFLVEFGEALSVNAALKSATHVNYDEVIPVQSPMVWFRNNRATNGNNKDEEDLSNVKLSLGVSMLPNNEKIINSIAAADSVSQQMTTLYEAWKLEEVDIRMRFLTAHQLERCFLGFFPHLTILPFGSSVNGFGKRGCDLDLALNFEVQKLDTSSSRFVFHSKLISHDGKLQSKKFLEIIADSIQYFMPGISNVRRILQARVPIIKFDQRLTGLECDLSMSNGMAVHMAELLCFYGEVDYRVRPLIFTIRHWAHHVGITNPVPGRWITNFSITLLVLFYLQQKRIIPSLDELEKLTVGSNVQSVGCPFLCDVTKLPIIDTNNDSLETLLSGFLEYYSTFDFSTKAISLREGKTLNKPDFSPLYICNPLEKKLNVSKNVSFEETEKLKLAVRNALWILETAVLDTTYQPGLLAILQQKLEIVNYIGGKRVVNVAALFNMSGDKKKSSKNQKKTEEIESSDEGLDLDSQSKRNSKKKKKRARPC